MKHNQIIWIVGAVGMLLLAGEGVARFKLGLGTPPLSVEHPTVEYLFKPNQTVYRFGNQIVINGYGMRSPDFPAQRSNPEELRIMVFGDSVINGGNLTDHDQLATTLVAQELANRHGIKALVGNISAGSWGPGNWLAYAKAYGFFDADAVVLVLSSHDYADNPSFAPLNPSTHPVRRPRSALTEALGQYLPRYWKKWVDSRAKNYDRHQPIKQTVNSADIKQGLQDLEEFLILAKARARIVIVFLHLEQEELSLNQIQEGHHKIIKLCDQLGISAISLRPFYQKSISRGVNLYRDEIHINEVGQQVLADAILSRLTQRVLNNNNRAPTQ